MRFAFHALGAAGLAVLAGCAQGTVSYDRDFGRLSDSYARAATGGRQPVEIVGSPPGGAGPEAVAAALRAPAAYGETTYVAIPPGTGGLRLVLEFGKRVGSSASCVSPYGTASQDRLMVAASLCRGERLLSTATLTEGPVAGPGDPAFGDSLALLLRELYTPNSRVPMGIFTAVD